MKRQDILLLVLSQAGQSMSPVQIQKSLFLVGQLMKDITEEDYYQFEPYHYGPFSSVIYSDIELEFSRQNVNIEKLLGQRWFSYSLTDKGKDQISKSVADDQKIVRNIKKIVMWVQGMSFEKLVASIYKHFPAFKKNSVFVDMR